MNKDLMSIKQTAELAGITVRTLQYYDKMGILKPRVESNGYRKYDEDSIKKLQQILFFTELGFPLQQIKKIMQSENYDEKNAMMNQKEMLILKRDRLNKLIKLIDKTIGGEKMSLKEFDMSEIEMQREKYTQEAKERWGETDAYKQSQRKTKDYNAGDWQKINDEACEIFSAFAICMRGEEDALSAEELSKEWQSHITRYYYDCTDEILSGLADMYILDTRFKENIDKYGDGVAEFMSASIKKYLDEK